MLYNQTLFPTFRLTNGTNDGFTVLQAAGYVRSVGSGFIALSPLGTAFMQHFAHKLRMLFADFGFDEIALPLLQRYELWEESGRAAKYGSALAETVLGSEAKRFVINPTQEEALLDLFRTSSMVQEQLPVRCFQIGERVRNELRPAHGLIRSRCFTLADAYVVSKDRQANHEEKRRMEELLVRLTEWLSLPVKRATIYGSENSSFWVPSVTKQCTVNVCQGCSQMFRSKEILRQCPVCSGTAFDYVEGAEIADVVSTETMLTLPMGVMSSKNEPLYLTVMGIGMSRIMQLLAECHHDDRGLAWPTHLAPFRYHILATESGQAEARAAYEQMQSIGNRVLFDCRYRRLSLGRALVDADLIGTPIRILFGGKDHPGKVEISVRKTGKKLVVEPCDLTSTLFLLNEGDTNGR